jgi:hypothetical protein
MSFFSSLCLFYPGLPPEVTVLQLKQFSIRLREIIDFQPWIQTVNLKFGKNIARDLKSTNELKEVAPFMFKTVAYKWDHESGGRDRPWIDLWPKSRFEQKSVYRSHLIFGGLPSEVSRELQSMHPDPQKGFIAPDMASLSIDPFSPGTLGDEEPRDIMGFLTLSFAGNGYFSWRDDPFGTYWREVQQGASLAQVRSLCRDLFPVPRLRFLDEMSNDLGELFLNREDYQDGDWVVTISETG